MKRPTTDCGQCGKPTYDIEGRICCRCRAKSKVRPVFHKQDRQFCPTREYRHLLSPEAQERLLEMERKNGERK